MERKKFSEQAAKITRNVYELSEAAEKGGVNADQSGRVPRKSFTRANIFDYGIDLCATGIGEETLDEILSNLVDMERNKEEKRLKILEKEAVLHIKKGKHPGLFLYTLLSHLKNEEIEDVKYFLANVKIKQEFNSLFEKPFIKNEIIDSAQEPLTDIKTGLFEFINSAGHDVLLEQLKQEKPEVIAYILAFIEPQKASRVLSGLPPGLQSDIAYRIAVMDIPIADLLGDVLRVEKKILSLSGKKYAAPASGEFTKILKTYLVRQKAVDDAQALYGQASLAAEGSKEAIELAGRLMDVMRGQPVDFIKTNPANFVYMLQDEHPQTIACILSVLEPQKAALMLQFLPPHLQCDAARRIVLMVSDDAVISAMDIRRIEKTLSAMFNKECTFTGGVKKLVELLILADSQTEKTILNYFEENYPEFAASITDNLFVFEDIVMLDGPAIQRVMRNADTGVLALALKNASAKIQELIFNNMSKRSAIMFKEDLECLESVSAADTEKAQQEILSIIRRMEETGELILARPGDSEYV